MLPALGKAALHILHGLLLSLALGIGLVDVIHLGLAVATARGVFLLLVITDAIDGGIGAVLTETIVEGGHLIGNAAFAADACAAPAFAADASASDTTFAPTDGREQGLYHGECVALGMIPLCTAPVRARLVPVLRALGLPTTRAFDAAAITQAIKHDKKSSQSGVTIITVPEIGTYTTEQTTAEALGKLLPLIQKKKV